VGPADRENYDVHISVNAVAELTKLPVSTAQRTLTHLELHKHSIGRLERASVASAARATAGPPCSGSAIGTTLLKRRREDPASATTHGDADPKASLQWA